MSARLFKASAHVDQVQRVVFALAASGSILLNGSINLFNAVHAKENIAYGGSGPKKKTRSRIWPTRVVRTSHPMGSFSNSHKIKAMS